MSSFTGTINSSVSIGGVAVSSNLQRTGSGLANYIADLPIAKAGTLSTRTSDTAGIITLAAGHGITDADEVDVYFSDGSVAYAATVTAYDTTTITIAGASGDALPTEDAAVTVGVVQDLDVDIEGDDLKMLAIHATSAASVILTTDDSGDTVELAKLLTANEAYTWAYDTGVTNPIASDTITHIQASCGSSSAAGVFKLAALVDAAG